MYLRKKQKRMKSLSNSFLRVICALVIGLVLVANPSSAGDFFVRVIGIALLVPSFVSIVGHFVRETEARPRFPIEGVGCALFGLWLILAPGTFQEILAYILGAILVIAGIHQLFSLWTARKWVKVPGGFYILPFLIFLAGLFALFNTSDTKNLFYIVVGVSCLLYAVSELVNWFKFTRLRPKKTATRQSDALQHVEDAQIIE